MIDTLLAQELAGVLTADAELAALFTDTPEEGDPVINIRAEQSGTIVTARPSLIVSGQYEPYGARRKGKVSLEMRSRIGQAGNHEQRFDGVWNTLLGAPGADNAETAANRAAAKAAIKAAIFGRGNVEIIEYGPSTDAVVADAEGEDLRTILTLAVVWRFLSV